MNAAPLDAETLHRFLDSNRANLWTFTPEKFQAWLHHRIREQEHNGVFQQKRRIRALLRPHRETLRQLEETLQQTRTAYELSSRFESIERLQKQILQLQRGVDGLSAAVAEGRAETAKLARHRETLRQHQTALDSIIAQCAELAAWELAADVLSKFHSTIGLTSAEAELSRLQHQRGRRSGAAGRRFEDIAEAALRQHLLSPLAIAPSSLAVLRGVTLGAAQTELDFVIGRVLPNNPVVDVLAIIEAKRNINDLVSGFLQRQRNLSWLTGDRTGYDAAAFRTRSFPTGHFDRPAIHSQDGKQCTLTVESFHRFHRDPASNWFLDRLCFITRLRPLLGVTTLEHARILNRVATVRDFDESSVAHAERLIEWARTFVSRIQSFDILRCYRSEQLARQIIVLDSEVESQNVRH
jgi:hypothetical protein